MDKTLGDSGTLGIGEHSGMGGGILGHPRIGGHSEIGINSGIGGHSGIGERS